jgi:TolA-binding protein
MKPHLHAVGLGTIVLLVVLQFPACSIFSPVGDAVSQGYENTVSYFNAYYNARKLFSEAEDEIRTAQLAMRGKEVAGAAAPGIPSTARSKLTLAIDKCSNILAFHPSGSLVDNALFMVGKSFFYLGEFLKAERKFAELQSQYPNSDLIPDAQFWYARCQERLNKLPETLQACDSLISESRKVNDRQREVDAELLKAKALRRLGDPGRAVEALLVALDRSPGDDVTAQLHIALGDAYASDGQDEKAVAEYVAAAELTDDLYEGYYAKFQAAIALRHLAQNDRSRQILEVMAADFRYREWLPSITFEKGLTLVAAGRTDDAVDAFRMVDTSIVRTDYSPRSAFELGRLNERVLLNYAEAKRYYGRVVTNPSPRIIDEAKRKFAALTKYLETTRKLFEQDSLWQAVHDTTAPPVKPAEVKMPTAVDPDMQDEAIEIVRDTTKRAPAAIAITNPDSLRRARMAWKQDLGDLFYSELEVADSAVYWYLGSMKEGTDSVRTPRVLYILGELARSNPDKGYIPAEERYRELIKRYPGTEYARAARRLLGERVSVTTTDPAELLYREAEGLIDSGNHLAAADRFRRLASRYPGSPFAAKAEYAVAWLLEYRLSRPEVAVEQYRRVLAVHAQSRYAPLALRKVVMANARRDSIAADSIRRAIRVALPDSSKKPVLMVPDTTARSKAQVPSDSLRKPVIPGPSQAILDSLKRNLRMPKPDSIAVKPTPTPQQQALPQDRRHEE